MLLRHSLKALKQANLAFLTNQAKGFRPFFRDSDVINHRRGLEINADKEQEAREWENGEKI